MANYTVDFGDRLENKNGISTNVTAIGTLSSLTTTAQDNLVNAINEVDATVGGVSIKYTYYNNSNDGTTLAILDYIFADTITAAFGLTLPAASTGLIMGNQIAILDSTGNFATNNLTITPDALDSIMGQAIGASIALDVDNREYKFIWSGSDWRVI